MLWTTIVGYKDQMNVGRTTWVIPEGYLIPEDESRFATPELVSHEAACLLNAGDHPAHVEIMLYFANREPVGPYRTTVPPRRTRHLRFNDLAEPAPVPRGAEYSSVITSNVPIVVQHTRLDSRDPAIALLSTVAYPA